MLRRGRRCRVHLPLSPWPSSRLHVAMTCSLHHDFFIVTPTRRMILLWTAIAASLTLNTLPLLRQVHVHEHRHHHPPTQHDNHHPKDNSDNGNNNDSIPTDCLVHVPIKAKFDHVEETNRSWTVLRQPTPDVCGVLRRDHWRYGMPVQSTLARELDAHQSNCSLPVAHFAVDNNYGLGSHIVLWSQALCNAMEQGYRVRTFNPEWLWMDKMYCDPQRAQLSPFLCYFPDVELRCTKDEALVVNHTLADPRHRRHFCERLQPTRDGYDDETLPAFRHASMEYLFQRLSPLVIKEAERQVGLLFGERAPPGLITVHIRWGDKFWEMELASIEEYMVAIERILQQRKINNSTYTDVNIYLACEDPQAASAFLEAAPSQWKVFLDRTLTELTPHRPRKGNRASWMARNTQGRAGLVALGSLLVAMEADDFVLTTSSNWSRLMDALRRNVIDPRCGNCTTAIDLRPGVW